MNSPIPNRPIDAHIAYLLYQLPLYEAWNEIDLPCDLKNQLNEADQQRLMSIAAYSLQRLMLSCEQGDRQDCT